VSGGGWRSGARREAGGDGGEQPGAEFGPRRYGGQRLGRSQAAQGLLLYLILEEGVFLLEVSDVGEGFGDFGFEVVDVLLGGGLKAGVKLL